MIKVVARNFVKTDKVQEVVEIFRELVEMTRKEKGCIKYELFQDVKNSEILTIIEEWESKEDLKNHMKSEHFQRILPQVKEFMEKDGEINVYTKLI